jgi:hypothetical protein
MSIIDLVFCEGPNARSIIHASVPAPWTIWKRNAFKILAKDHSKNHTKVYIYIIHFPILWKRNFPTA